MTSWGCAQSKEAIQNHWLVDNSTASAFGAYTNMTKMQAVQVGTMEQSIRRAGGQALVWIILYSLHHRIRAIVQTEDSHMPYQINNCYIVSLVTYPIINPHIYILIWSYPWAGSKYAQFCLWFALILLYIIEKNITYAKSYFKFMKHHFCFTYFLNER